ncbi:hypothetical protein SDC9_80942 [bioreactor metagenome]|uniref:Uncharacterized protein n=2 Tax=root TaxID=1 RepID=A0A644Z0F4_9ZZZZ
MNDNVLDHVRTGREGNGGTLWRLARQHRARRIRERAARRRPAR